MDSCGCSQKGRLGKKNDIAIARVAMSTIKILHVLDHSLPVHSGYAFRSHAIFSAQKRRGWDPVVLTSPKHHESCSGPREEQEQIGDIRYYRSSLVPKRR